MSATAKERVSSVSSTHAGDQGPLAFLSTNESSGNRVIPNNNNTDAWKQYEQRLIEKTNTAAIYKKPTHIAQ